MMNSVTSQQSIAVDSKPDTHQIEVTNHDQDIKRADGDVAAIISDQENLDLWQTLKTYPKASLFCACAAVGAISDGYQFNMPGNIIANTGFIRQFGAPNASGKYALNSTHVSLWGGTYTIAYIVSLIAGTWPSDKFGRKAMLLVIQVLFAAACILEMFATNWTHWLGAKILNGFSIGLNQMTLVSYLSEVAPVRARGALVANYSIWWGLGGFACSIALQILSTMPADKWRTAIYSEWIFTGIALIVLLIIPESPRWHCERGNDEKARKILTRIHGNVSGFDLDKEYGVLLAEVQDGRRMAAANKEVSILTCLRGVNLRRTYIAFMPFAWVQWAGGAVINGYTTYYFQLAGMQNPFNASLAINCIKIACTFIAPVMVELAGRRRLLLIGGCIMPVALYVVAGMLRVPGLSGNAGLGIGLITVSCIWEAAYASTLSVVSYVYLGETSTVLLRSKTTGMAAAGTGFTNLIVSYCTPLMLASPSFGTSATTFFYASTCLLGTVIVYFTIPETKGRSYIELDELFERRISARQFEATETEVDKEKTATALRGQV